MHEPALLLEGEIVDPLTLLGGAQREQRHDLRLPAAEERRAVRARRDADLARDRANVLRSTSVRAALVDGDLLADQVLVDRVGCTLEELLRHRVLRGGLSLGCGRPGREG